MADEARCQLCGRPIQVGAHYVVRIDVFADPAAPAIDLEQQTAAQVDESFGTLMKQLAGMSLDELQDSVHRRFEYKLCPPCHRQYLANPLGSPRGQSTGVN